ncbi:MAG: hypothetical protein AB9842_03310 [Bacteroidales bacterium]
MHKHIRHIKLYFENISYGLLASAFFLISLVTGVFLALFYDPVNPYQSLTGILLYNPWASYWRNLHYWSAQFFLITFIIHFWGYLKEKNFVKLKPGIWFRLSLAVVFVFLVMFTGFLLKGDEDSRQASLIFRSLLDAIPFAGTLLSGSLLGKPDTYILPYVHHIATTSIILLIIIREHSRRLWTGWHAVYISLIPVAILCLFLVPPLHDAYHPVVKGPWYFVGLQELLHWTTRPGLIWLAALFFILIIFMLRNAGRVSARVGRIVLLLMLGFYGLLTVTGVFFRGEYWQWTLPGRGENSLHYAWIENVLADKTSSVEITDSVRGKESCLHCHDRFTGLSGEHAPEKIGCYSCHGGNKFSLDKDVAHRNMRLLPGNLKDAGLSCGTASCHPDIIPRINNSLMTRLTGLIAVDRWVFGETPTPDVETDLHHLENTGAGLHLKNLCLSCHLGGLKQVAGPVTQTSRGGGCLACHLNYDSSALTQYRLYEKNRNSGQLRDFIHPAIDVKVSNDHCFGCHSRSGRISLSYEGWAEILPQEAKDNTLKKRRLEDGRLLEFVADDVHHKGGMRCIDCHSARDVMGDAVQHIHKEEAVTISCTDCHIVGRLRKVKVEGMDYESAKLRKIWKMDSSSSYLLQQEGGVTVLGARMIGDSLKFYRRTGGKALSLKSPASVCSQGKAHEQLHCSACHAAWAPRCMGCHTSFNDNISGTDLLELSPTRGKWEEAMAGFLYGPPTLGVRTIKNTRQYIPVVPGMIMTLEQAKSKGSEVTFHRLFAPLDPHTTQSKGRDCRSCHNDPVALGYGEGSLEYKHNGSQGKWYFTPAYEKNREDGLPMDAWIGFLEQRKGAVATRTNVRPMNIKEQQKMLRAGACLTCHEGNSGIMLRTLENLDSVIRVAGKRCVIPVF